MREPRDATRTDFSASTGTWRGAYTGLADRFGAWKLLEEHLIEFDVSDPNKITLVANVAERWEQNADASEFTFYLRKGIRWSNGQELTSEDARFWYEDIQLNKDIIPTPSTLIRQRVGEETKVATLTVVDKYTFRVKYPAPNPLLPIQIPRITESFPAAPEFMAPSAFLKGYHPKYTDHATLDKAAKDKKVGTWQELWGRAGDLGGPVTHFYLNADIPVIHAWKVEVPAPGNPMSYVRNPYYWQVDTAGNQLPYIDKIEHALIDNAEGLKLAVAGGRIDCQVRNIDAGAYTFFKENEQRGNYRVFRWRQANAQGYWPNANHADKVLAKLFDTPAFRQALSIAIDRKTINELIWSGLYTAGQYSPVKGSPEYDEGMRQAWAEYDPARANALLDELGLTKGSDGYRKRPDGKTLEIQIDHINAQGSSSADQHDRVRKYWEAIGVKTSVQFLERSLWEQRCRNGDTQVTANSMGRLAICKALPSIWLGTDDLYPWAPLYGHWYDKLPAKQEEPPQDHPIRQVWKYWEQCRVEPDEAKRNAYFQQVIGEHKAHPFFIGVVTEGVAPMIVANGFRNIVPGYINDDALRDIGIANPQQFFFKR